MSRYDYDKMLTMCAGVTIGMLLRGQTSHLAASAVGAAVLLYARTRVPRQEDMPREVTVREWLRGHYRRWRERARERERERHTVKLVYCRKCYDWVALHYYLRVCECGRSGGWYERDGDRACVGTPDTAVVFGLDNRVLVKGRADVFRYEDIEGKLTWLTEDELHTRLPVPRERDRRRRV